MTERITIRVHTTIHNSQMHEALTVIGSDGIPYIVTLFPAWLSLRPHDQLILEKPISLNRNDSLYTVVGVHGTLLDWEQCPEPPSILDRLFSLSVIQSLVHAVQRYNGLEESIPVEEALRFED